MTAKFALRSSTWFREVITFAGFMVAVLAARSSLADHYVVPSESMTPTVQVGDRLVVDKRAYDLRVPFTRSRLVALNQPSRGDVVVLTSPETGITLLKRVVAVPGDLALVSEGRLFLNGQAVPIDQSKGQLVEKLDDQWHDVQPGGPDFAPTVLGTDDFLVMGDNRPNSHDGRMFGLVGRDAILGRAIAVYYRDGLVWHNFFTPVTY